MITDNNDIKMDYLYQLKDRDDFLISVIYKSEGSSHWSNVLVAGTLHDDYETYNTGSDFEIHNSLISPVPETDENFDDNHQWAVYEIGHKDDHPEYFL